MISLSIVLCMCATQTQGDKTPLYVGGILGMTDNHWSRFARFYDILFRVAFDEINNRTDLLPEYELNFISKDSKGKAGLAAKALYQLLYEPPFKIAILGPPLSDEFDMTAAISPYFNLVQMGFLSKSSNVKDRDIYSSVYMTNYIQDDLNPLRIALMRYFKWTKVATLIYDEEIFVSQYGARIIIGAFRSTDFKAPEIFCEVYKNGLYGKKYVWILTGSSLYKNWIKNLNEDLITCSRSQIYEAAEGHLTLSQKQLSTSDSKTISGRTPSEYNSWIQGVASNVGMSLSKYNPWAYDAAWALAKGLNNSLSFSSANGSLSNFSYTRSDIFHAIQLGMDDVLFDGVSGRVSFQNGRRIGPAFIELNRGDNRSTFAKYDPYNNSITWYQDPHRLFKGPDIKEDIVVRIAIRRQFIVFVLGSIHLTVVFILYVNVVGLYSNNGYIPRDSFLTFERKFNHSVAGLVIVLIMLASCMTIAIGFLAFNIYFRNNRNIKMSSPRINNVIIGGGIIIYFSILLTALDYGSFLPELSKRICMVNVWLTSMGFTAAFGALFSKTWRVHILFTQGATRKQIIQDSTLFGILGLLLLLEVMFLSAWSLIHPLKLVNMKAESTNEDMDTIVKESFPVCKHEFQTYWFSAAYISKGLLLALGTFLAWETRHIKVPSLNDSKHIGFCVYNIVVVCTLCVPITFFLPAEKPTVKFIFTSLVCIFTTTIVLCILFIPKIKLRNSTEDTLKFNPKLTSKSYQVNNNTKRSSGSKTEKECLSEPITEVTSIGRKPYLDMTDSTSHDTTTKSSAETEHRKTDVNSRLADQRTEKSNSQEINGKFQLFSPDVNRVIEFNEITEATTEVNSSELNKDINSTVV